MHRSALAGILAAALSAQSPPPLSSPATPAQRPLFKTGVNYVEVDANVVDSAGKFVEGLTKDDFAVVEDGTPQGAPRP